MMFAKKLSIPFFLLGCVWSCPAFALAQLVQEHASAEANEFFEQKIRPVLVKRCYSCHSSQADSVEADLRLDTRAGLQQGGERGAAIEAHNPDASLLIRAIRYTDEELQMPPDDAGGRLTDEEVAHFEEWVRQGAPFPEAIEPLLSAQEQIKEKARTHWSFQPIAHQAPPTVMQSDWVATEVDSFILAALEQRGLTPSPPAARRTLLKRAKYDLLGLPATFDEIEAFANDSSPDAYANLIERYLASPHYGERWGRYWLDVARYADTKGYAYAREERRFVHAHAYRDWVVQAFNDDMRYDRFLTLQIAADQVGDSEGSSLAAMGFLTVGRRFINVTPDIIDDRIDVVCRGTMGLTVGCARCHDHKYDPIPTADYYSLYGVFQGSAEKMKPLGSLEDSAHSRAFVEELTARQKALETSFEAKRDELLNQLRANAPNYVVAVLDVARLPTAEFYMTMGADEVNPVFVRQWHTYISSTRADDPIFAPWHAFAAIASEEFSREGPQVVQKLVSSGVPLNAVVVSEFAGTPPGSMKEVAQRYGKLIGEAFQAWQTAINSAKEAAAEPPAGLADPAQEALRQVLYGPNSPIHLPALDPAEAEFFFAEQAREELGQAQARIDQWIVESEEGPPFAIILQDRPVQQNPRIFVRGNSKNLGSEVPRRFLEALTGPDRPPFHNGSGRLELAEAITHPQNPLTARVIANRVWLYHFGTGLVATPSDFGLRSEPPTHPDLLDYLARRFLERGWSIKDLHRLIMLSNTYQQASEDRAEARAIDADNELYWRMNVRRLDFEATRDSLLFVSGQLDPQLGGRAMDLTSRPFSRRRTIYGYIDRLNLPTMYRSFDFASPDAHSPQRYETMVPQQALFLMNHPFVVEQARQLAAQPAVAQAQSTEERIEVLYRRIFGRSATPDEIALATTWLAAATQSATAAKSTDGHSANQSVWSYGFIEGDSRTASPSFKVLPYFTNSMWHAGPQLPDLKCDWSLLTSTGGNVGRDGRVAVVRRWTAPAAGNVEIEGSIEHGNDEGDGICARILHSRRGEVASWKLHKLATTCTLKGLPVEAGDTIDFVVDGREEPSKDEFTWAPVLRMEIKKEGEEKPVLQQWDAREEFGGPQEQPLTEWERYVHVLLQSNEFAVVD